MAELLNPEIPAYLSYKHGKGKRSKAKFVGSKQFTGIDPNKAGKAAQRRIPGRKIPGARIPSPLGGR